MSGFSVVTGAFSYTGKYIAQALVKRGVPVRTLTGHPNRPNPFGASVTAAPLDFEDADRLVENLRGATTLYNTYWVRFSHGGTTFDDAVRNTGVLIRAAEEAGVRRLVHVSITNPSEDSRLPYFRGKAVLERTVRESRLSHAIIRPAVIFADEDVLMNNTAWLLRRFPLFVIPGSGEYKLQPVFADDMAELAVDIGHREDNVTVDAVGPEVFTFNELVALIASAVGSRARVVHLPARVALVLARVIGYGMRDVLLTRDEVDGLASNLLVSRSNPTGRTRFSVWLQEHAATVGVRYASELGRHYR